VRQRPAFKKMHMCRKLCFEAKSMHVHMCRKLSTGLQRAVLAAACDLQARSPSWMQTVQHQSVKELKQIAKEVGLVSLVGCAEKADIIELILEKQQRIEDRMPEPSSLSLLKQLPLNALALVRFLENPKLERALRMYLQHGGVVADALTKTF
jgi:hypothetical protein